MRILKVLLPTLALALLSASAWGDGAPDPTITIQKASGSTATETGEAQTDPLMVLDASGTTDWLLNNPTIAEDGALYVEVIPYTGENLAYFNTEVWQCAFSPPTTTGCGFVMTMGSVPGYEFVFYGPFTVGEDIGISVPEPNALFLLIFGLGVFLAYGFRKRLAILT